MFFVFLIVAIAYASAVILFSGRLFRKLSLEIDQGVASYEEKYKGLLKTKDSLCGEKGVLEENALRIFTLYEMTREITKSLKQEDAFDIFKKKLSEHVHFEECFYIDPMSSEAEDLKKYENYFVFTLQGKNRKTGYLAIKGISPQDNEKIMILGHQYSLALRRVNLYEEIEQIAITDSLTGLHTRRYLMDRFKEEVSRSQSRNIKMSILMVDVDLFKKFNDQYGHLVGDQILYDIGKIIKDNIREIDIAGRYGGEEFCVVLPDTDLKGAIYAAERIRQAAEKATIRAYDTEVNVTLSIGVATFPTDGKVTLELIDKADWALYRAKKLGRNRVCSFGVYES